MISKIRELLDPKGFFAALWPYRFSSMVFGHCNAASKKLRAIYAIIIVSVHLLLSYFAGYDNYKSYIQESESDVQVCIAYFGFLFRSTAIPMHTLMWFFVGHACYVEIVSSLTFVDRELTQLCCKHVNLKVMIIKQLVCIAVSVSVVLMLILGQIFYQLQAEIRWEVIQIISFHYNGIITTIVMSIFGNLVHFTGDRYALINSALNGIGGNLKKGRENLPGVVLDEATLTRQLRIIHRKLFFVSRKIMEAFGLQAFAWILSSYIYILNELYQIYRTAVSPCGKSVEIGILLFVIAIFSDFAIVVYVSYCCHQTVQEANGTMKILNALTISSEDLRMEVTSFSYQLMHYQLSFSPLGFFQLDLALVQNMVGTMATYLVILVQLESVSSECMKDRTAV